MFICRKTQTLSTGFNNSFLLSHKSNIQKEVEDFIRNFQINNASFIRIPK